jgi:hypothetical protein
MRERHLPRVCPQCRAPMARQEPTCWRCGAESASDGKSRATLRLIPGGATRQLEDAARWTNEAAALGCEVTQPLPAIVARR